jgi:chaperonin GroES
MKELQPINQQVLLDLSESKMKQTASGIIIPDTVEEKPMFAKVLSLSNIESPEINVGETVLFKKYSGTEIEFEGRKYLLMPYADILAKIVETEEI